MNKKQTLRIGKYFLIFLVVCIALVLLINLYVKQITKNQIVKEASNLSSVDAILVLGAAIWGDKPSPMLEDRLLISINLYNEKIAPKIIMSGDHGREEYDEVNHMKNFAKERGVQSSDIFMDHAGFSTYESIYRAKEIFGVKKVIIVTQEYHLYRALYIAKKLGLEAYGVPANQKEYNGQLKREIREILARDKDFFKCIIKPKPKFLGNEIPIESDGDLTND